MSKTWILLIGATIFLGLILDQLLQPFGQYFVNAFVCCLFLFLAHRTPQEERKKWWICLILATAGEILLCELGGLYTYRESNIPLFVPPGHVLLYAAGLGMAKHIPKELPWFTLIIGVGYSAYCLLHDFDQISLVLFALWLLMFFKTELRPLTTTMLLLALVMEIFGTGLGNWAWSEQALLLGLNLSQNNPPFAVGVLYCGLDFLVGLFCRDTA